MLPSMRAERRRPQVSITTVPRNTLAHTYHKEIDAILKDLKFCSRRLKAALDSFKDDIRILERLYYKCKNQHRMALFFKRVPEIRRYGRRLVELDISERMDLLRVSFVGLEHMGDHKALRGSWSHIPEKPYVDFLIERLTACIALIRKMRDRLDKAYHHFTLAIQNGAFVQVIVLFIAISSRMSVLSSELEGALQLGISTCNRLLVVIHPTGAQQRSSEPGPLCPSRADHGTPPEDTGQIISFHEPVGASVIIVGDPNAEMEAISEVRVMPASSHPTDVDDRNAAQLPSTKVAQKPRVKKSRKKLDEIDEIFGF